MHKQLHSIIKPNQTRFWELGKASFLRGPRSQNPLPEDKAVVAIAQHLLQSQSPSPGGGWRRAPGPQWGSPQGNGSAAPGPGGWCGRRSHCCHYGQIASSLQTSEGAQHMAVVREGRQRPQNDVTPHTAQLRWPANRPTGEWEDIDFYFI